MKLPHHFHRFFFQQTWINIEFQLHRQFYEPISESVCWALLNQQWQGRWARVTMSSCLFWDQLRQYSQVWANRLHAMYKNIFLEKKYTRLFRWACSRLRALNLALTLFVFLLTFITPTFSLFFVDWCFYFYFTLKIRTDCGPKSLSWSQNSVLSYSYDILFYVLRLTVVFVYVELLLHLQITMYWCRQSYTKGALWIKDLTYHKSID